jgi:pyruvate carboxylase subunit B
MKYFVALAGRTIEVDVDGARVTVDGAPFEAHFAPVAGTPLHHLLLSGASWLLAADGSGGPAEEGAWIIGAAGERFAVIVVDEATRDLRALAPPPVAAPAGGTVAAPMPGLVVRVEVVEGQRVEAGAGLVVLEAMKMENELRAPHAGVIARVHVQVGEPVEKGAPMVTFDDAEPSS